MTLEEAEPPDQGRRTASFSSSKIPLELVTLARSSGGGHVRTDLARAGGKKCVRGHVQDAELLNAKE